MHTDRFDVCVVGAGFGGLATALALAEAGARVCLCETLRYPGGCASTFRRNGYHFESGATLLSGLSPNQLLGGWLARYSPELELDWTDPLLELRAPSLRLSITRKRRALIDQLVTIPGAPVAALERFFTLQAQIAETLWEVLDDPELLPPFNASSLLQHATRLPRYAPLLRWIGRPLDDVLNALSLRDFSPLRTYLDALCQITVQCSSREAETPFALGALDYYYHGTAHVRGGIGRVAEALVDACRRNGAEVRMSNRVQQLAACDDGSWRIHARHGVIEARHVVTNLVPTALKKICTGVTLPPDLDQLESRIADGWGASMIYAVARAPANAPAHAHHLELISDEHRPFTDGNHVFVSISGENETERAPSGHRTLTMSTHVALAALRAQASPQAFIERIQSAMTTTFERGAPEWHRGVVHQFTASPRTFARFVGRPEGAVGGIPRRAGLVHYRKLAPRAVLPGLWMVGDSVFPGQSALAAALGGVRLAAAIRKSGYQP